MITLSITSAGTPWSAADLARITPDPEAPLCSVQTQLEALGYRVTAIQGLGTHVSAEVEARAHAFDDVIDGVTYCSGCGYWEGAVATMPTCPGRPTKHQSMLAADADADFDADFDLALAKAALEHNLRGGGA